MVDKESYNCENCMFYVPNKDKHGSEGICIRYPPQAFPLPLNKVIGGQPQFGKIVMRPTTYANELCGEFQSKPTDATLD